MDVDWRYFNKIEEDITGKINGAFSTFDMAGLKTGTDRLKAGDVYLEVGTQNGRSTYAAMKMLPEGVKMFAVDIADAGGNQDTLSRKEWFEVTGLDKVCTFIHAPSDKAAAEWDGTLIDMIFIDADHTAEGVRLDVDSWAPFLKPGGYIYFHDADATSPGVEELVREMGASDDYDEMHFYIDSLQVRTSLASVRKK